MKIWALLFLSTISHTVHSSSYFDTKFLVQYDAVRAALQKDGFEEVFFTTHDNLKLNALLRTHPNARANIICFAGWYPGRKESLAPFFAMFGNKYNMLLVDARGHGISQGPLFSNIWHYGLTDYHDTLAALDYLKLTTGKPSFIIGICAGAFNAAHAACILGDTAYEKGLRGLVFDSGWGSLYETSYTAPVARVTESIAKGFAWLYDLKPQQARDTIMCNIVSHVSAACIYGLHTLFLKPVYAYYNTTTNLHNIMHRCTVPVFFIHSHDDTYASITQTQELARITPRASYWWITEPSKHAAHHFKHTAVYQDKVTNFFDSFLRD
jgi:pimeloyl-ACP methyl ester carboxylesterase